MPRVERHRHVARLEDVDVGRERAVQGLGDRLRRQRRTREEVRHLPLGVHALVGAPRPDELRRLSENLADGRQDLAGHGALPLLHLPACVACPFVLDHEAHVA